LRGPLPEEAVGVPDERRPRPSCLAVAEEAVTVIVVEGIYALARLSQKPSRPGSGAYVSTRTGGQ
jgi:hypothetical protein